MNRNWPVAEIDERLFERQHNDMWHVAKWEQFH